MRVAGPGLGPGGFRDPRTGALLLEAIFALFLLGVVALATLALLASSLAHFEVAESRGRALPLATEWLEAGVTPWGQAAAGEGRHEPVASGVLRQEPGESPVHEHPRAGSWPVVPPTRRGGLRRRGARGARARPWDTRQGLFRGRCRGHTLAELVVALFLAGLLAAIVAALLSASTRAVVNLVVRSDEAELRRSVAALLHAELSVGVPGRDWALEGTQALRLRAFRGYGVPCEAEDDGGAERGGAPGHELLVRWRGDRWPDPARDSVLVLAPTGTWGVAPLEGAQRGGVGDRERCPPEPGERIERWTVGPPVAGAVAVPIVLRVFESGRYSLEGGALRYRQGGGVRQPLTPEVLPAGSRFLAADAPSYGSVVVELPPLRWTVHGDRTAGGLP